MKKYRETGLKLTPQRIAILRCLEGNKSHPSAEDIYREVSMAFPTMSLATVYNTLDALKQKDGVMELAIDPAKKRFDPDTKPHNHLICTECREIIDIYSKFEPVVPEHDKHGYEIMGSHIEFYGLCPNCKTRSGGKQ